MPKKNERRQSQTSDNVQQKPRKKRNVSRSVPDFGEIPFAELIQKGRLFDSCVAAATWFAEPENARAAFGEGEQYRERIDNIGTWFETPGTEEIAWKTVERAIVAQVAWVEFFPMFSAIGELKVLAARVQDLRMVDFDPADAESIAEDEKDYVRACEALLEAAQDVAEDAQTYREETLKMINGMLDKEAFKARLERDEMLHDKRQGVDDPLRVVRMYQSFIAGEELNLYQLKILREQLEYHWAKIYPAPFRLR